MIHTRLYRLVRRILASNHLTFREEDSGLVLEFDSAAVRIDLATVGEQQLIHLRSVVLSDIPASTSQSEVALREVNFLNAEHLFGRWAFYEEQRLIGLEYDLLGDHLQPAELMTALAAIARQADREDDRLQRLLGGRRAVDTDPAEPPAGDWAPRGDTEELEVSDLVQMLAEHKSKQEIADELGVERRVVSKSIRNLAAQLGVPTAKRGEIVNEARRRGLSKSALRGR